MQLVVTHAVRAQIVLLLASLLPLRSGHAAEVDAATLVAPELLSGPGWQVEPRAEVRGYQARFILHTDWGTLNADSVELLALRVSEMPALAALHGSGISESVSAAGGARLLAPAHAVANIARQPLRTMRGLPGGVSRYFGERWQRLRDGARRLGDASWQALAEDGSPYEETEGPMAAAGHTPERQPGWWRRRGDNLSAAIKYEAGYALARRQLAERLGIDPYTSNPLIAPRLDGLAWAQTSGGWATGQALALLGPVGAALGYAVSIDRMVLQEPPAQVRVRNHEALLPHCSDEALLRAFLRHGAFTPQLQTDLVQLYLQLAPVHGCAALLETALMADNEAQARFVIGGLRLLAHHLGEDSRGGRIVPQGALLAYETTRGEFVLPLAVDWLTWTAQLRRWFDLPVIGHRPYRTLLVSGAASPKAQRELTERGWSILTRLPYPGAPPYKRSLVFTPSKN